MCGIVGVAYKRDYGFAKKHVDIFSQLLRVNELRGADSTGVIYVKKDGDFAILKEASPSSWAVSTMFNHDILRSVLADGKVLIGHNRAATVGRVTDETAHPFVVEDSFAMVHNGTLYGHKGLKDTEVDSEALAHHLQPLLEASELDMTQFEEEVGKVNGAYAISAYSQKQHKVFLMRNSLRPLAVVETPDAWYWASEGMMLMWILARNNEQSKDLKFLTLKDNMLMTIDLNKNTLVEEEYVPKKAMAPATHTRVTGAVGTTTKMSKHTPTVVGLSKQEVKRLRRTFLGTRQLFWAEDYVETFFPKTILEGESALTLMGRLEGEEFPSGRDNCTAKIDAGELFGDKWLIKDVLEGPYSGVVETIQYDKRTSDVVYVLRDVRPFPKSTDVKQAASKIVEDTRSKWTALPPPKPADLVPTRHPDEMTEAEWKDSLSKYTWNFTTKKWDPKDETSPTVH